MLLILGTFILCAVSTGATLLQDVQTAIDGGASPIGEGYCGSTTGAS